VAAEQIAKTPPNSVILVSSSGYGEGMFIAELAEHEKRLSHIVLRASQQLATTDWDGEQYNLRYKTPAEVERALEEIPVNFVVIHTTWPAQVTSLHQQQLLDAIQQHSDSWELFATDPSWTDGNKRAEIRIFRCLRTEPKRRQITVDLTNKINKVLQGQF
jgi:hypothetical protein